MSREKQFCRNCGKRDSAFSLEDTVRFWEPGLCSECHCLPIIGTRYDVFTGERIEPTPTHDGKLAAMRDKPYEAKIEFFDVHPPTALLLLSGGYGTFDAEVYFDPQQALSLLVWLIQEREKLEALAKEQVEPDETYLDLAEHLPPAVWKTSQARTCSLTAACLSCHAEMHGEWEGESPYTLVCPSCGASHSIEERIS